VTTVLIDGNSLTYRAFFALPTDMATAGGQVTNAVYGFTSMLINLLRDHRPDRIAVAFDLAEPTFRHDRVVSYKAQRDATPELLVEQFGLVREVLSALRIPVVTLAGFEADDVIATLATRSRDAGDDVLVVTGDRDVYQLVEDPHVKVLYNKRGVSDYALYDEAGILERTGVRPVDYVDYAALRGDPSDNLPGVPGVGEKTAAKLINTYGGLDGIFAHVDEQTPKLRQNLTEHEDTARLNVEMMRLVRDAPVETDLDALRWTGVVDVEEVRRLFDFLEFRALATRLAEVVGASLDDGDDPGTAGAEVLEAEVSFPSTAAELTERLDALGPRDAARAISGVWSDDRRLQEVVLVVDPAAGEVLAVDLALLDDAAARRAFDAALASAPLAAHGAKAIVRGLLDVEVEVATLAFDTMLAAYLVDPAESRYLLGEVLLRYTGAEIAEAEAAAPEGELAFGSDAGDDLRRQVAAREALAVDRLVVPLGEALEARGMLTLLHDIEVPLVGVLARMEHVGVGVDEAVLRDLNADLTARCSTLRDQIRADAGHDFNVNSTKQLRTVLFDELGLAPQKKTKTGYSTDAASLEKLRGQHPIIEHLLGYREIEKLRSTYGEGLLAEVRPDGRIHATFNQTVARTGRLSSDQPNLHNIPVRTDEGRAFRRAFVPRAGAELLVADYNQVELRCIAHLSGDPGLVGAFARGDDIHTATASRVFGVPEAEVTHEQRAKAKMVSYGLAYGMEAYGLAQRLGIEVSEASTILEAYFAAFPSVHAYMQRTVDEARERGYTETLFGRRRPIPELASSNARIRQAGERQAMNAGIQGLAADIFKIALVRLDAALRERRPGSTLILQVHDEVILEVPTGEHDEAEDLTRSVMTGAAELSVPLEVHLAFGANWADAKG